MECAREKALKLLACIPSFLDCNSLTKLERQYWANVTHVLAICDARNNNVDFKFGMFADAFANDVFFLDKLFKFHSSKEQNSATLQCTLYN